jgi:chorismate mutase
MLEENEANVDDVVSIIFTSTDDLSSEFPAVGAREAGLWSIPLLCAREIPVPGSQPRCIRALAHAYLASDLEVRHVYLRDASALRPDLAFTSHDGTIPHER